MRNLKFNLLSYLSIIIILIGCSKSRDTVVEGCVRNYYNNKPIESAKVFLVDGLPVAGTPPPGYKYPNESVVNTDKNGYFLISLQNGKELPVIFVSKIGYKFDPNWNDGASVGVQTIDYGHRYMIFLLKPDTSFCGTIINKGEKTDSIKISFLNFHSPEWSYKSFNIDDNVYIYGDNVEGKKLIFSGNGPWNICDNNFIYYNTIDKYLRYNLEINRNGIWTSIIDSINLETLNTHWDTYAKAIIEIK